VIALEVYLGAVVQLEAAMMTLFADVFEFAITTRKPVSAIEVIDAQGLVTEPVSRFDQVTRMRRPVQKAEVCFTKPFVEIAEHTALPYLAG